MERLNFSNKTNFACSSDQQSDAVNVVDPQQQPFSEENVTLATGPLAVRIVPPNIVPIEPGVIIDFTISNFSQIVFPTFHGRDPIIIRNCAQKIGAAANEELKSYNQWARLQLAQRHLPTVRSRLSEEQKKVVSENQEAIFKMDFVLQEIESGLSAEDKNLFLENMKKERADLASPEETKRREGRKMVATCWLNYSLHLLGLYARLRDSNTTQSANAIEPSVKDTAPSVP